MPLRLRTLTTATALALLAAGSGTAAADDANVVKYRQTFMKATGAHLGMISAVVKGEVDFTDQIAANAQSLALMGEMMAASAQQMFPEGSGDGSGLETRALPAIWENWAGFEEDVTIFQQETAKLAEVAQSGDMAAIGQQLGALGKNACGACHTDFRKKS